MIPIKKGSTSVSVDLFIADSSVTTGAGKTGLLFNTASLVAYYHRPGATPTAITLATQTVTGAFSSGGFVELDATNYPGMYRLDIPDAALATGVDWVTLMLKGAANMAPVVARIPLVAYDPQDTVRLGLTAMPNVASGGDGSIMLRGASQDTTLKSLTISNSAGDALVISATGGNGDGIQISGNGSGSGVLSTGGATGQGMRLFGGATSGAGFSSSAQGAGAGMSITGVGTAAGIDVLGGSGGNANGLLVQGTGTGDGFKAVAGATGHGFEIVGGSTSGDGIRATVTSGVELNADMTGNITGNLSGSVGSVTGAVGSVAGAVGSVGTGGITTSSFAAGAINAAAIAADAITDAKVAADVTIASVTGAVGSVTSGVTVTTNNDKTGYALTAAGVDAIWDELQSGHVTAGSFGVLLDVAVSGRMATYTQPTGFLAATFPTTLASTTNITGGTITTVTNLTNAPTSGDLTAAMKASVNTECDTALVDVGLTTTITGRIDAAISSRLATAGYTAPLDTAGTRSAVGLATANLDTQLTAIAALWTTALTESYAADGATFTPAQALYMIWSAVADMTISGTTLTCRKVDGATTSMTFTLDSAASPTSRTRSG